MTLINKYYLCTNVENCELAFKERLFTENQFVEYNGKCPGSITSDSNKQCGHNLQLAKTNDQRPLFFTSLLLIIGLVYFLFPIIKQQLFPAPITQIMFASPSSKVSESEFSIDIVIKRNAKVKKKVIIHYQTLSNSATGDQDYESSNGTLIFQPNEQEKFIVIPILQDNDYREGTESFLLQLTNVEGQPKHRVFINDSKLDENSITKADTLVRSASIVAKDLADFYVKDRVLRQLTNTLSQDNSQLPMIRSSLKSNDDNLLAARERYIELFKDLSVIDQRSVASSINNWIAHLERQGIEQQRAATRIMQEQLSQYIDTRIIEMDIWLQQLSKAIPKISNVNSTSESKTQI